MKYKYKVKVVNYTMFYRDSHANWFYYEQSSLRLMQKKNVQHLRQVDIQNIVQNYTRNF